MQLSVVVPTRNRHALLRLTLPTMLRQSLPRDQYELIVVDDGSTDETASFLRSLDGVVVLRQPNRGPAVARNLGLRHARGEIVLFLDDDDVCTPDLLTRHVEAHRAPGQRAAFGPRFVAPESPPSLALEWTRRQTDRYLQRLADSGPRIEFDAFVDPNTSLPRVLLLAHGGFDERFERGSETADLGLRLWKSGVAFTWLPDAATFHTHVKSGDELVHRDAPLAGREEVLLTRAHPDVRARCSLGLIAEGSPLRRAARQAAVRLPMRPDRPLALASGVAERLERLPLVGEVGISLLWARMGIEVYRAAQREVGSWRALRREFGLRLPVLLYHRVAPRCADEPGALTVSAERFERDVAWLHSRGYVGIRPAEWAAWRDAGARLPERPVLIAFDDGYADLVEHALPALQRVGFGAAIFVVTGQVGGVNQWDAGSALPRRSLMSAEQLREATTQGFEIGVHGRQHLDLCGLAPDSLRGEIVDARDDLEAMIGARVGSFAYPWGRRDDAAARLAGETFDLSFTVDDGINTLQTPREAMRRSMVQPGDTPVDLASRVSLGWSPLARARGRLGRLASR